MTGQTTSHGAFSQCMQVTGWWRVSGLSMPARVVAVDADPLHRAAALDLVLADDRDVVLGLAGDDAGVAAHAGGEVDRESPRVAAGRHLRIERHRGPRRRLAHLRDGVGIAPVLLRRDRADQVAALHAPVMLRRGERGAAARLCDLEPGADPERVAPAQRVGVEALAVGDAPASRAAVAEVERDAVLGLSRHDPDGRRDLAARGTSDRRRPPSSPGAALPWRGRSAPRSPTSASSAASASSCSQPLLA